MTALHIALIVAGVLLISAATFFWLLAKAVDQLAEWEAEEQSRDDLTDADRIWREDTALKAINLNERF